MGELGRWVSREGVGIVLSLTKKEKLKDRISTPEVVLETIISNFPLLRQHRKKNEGGKVIEFAKLKYRTTVGF